MKSQEDGPLVFLGTASVISFLSKEGLLNPPCFISSIAILLKKGGLGQQFTIHQYPLSMEGCFQDHSFSPVAAHVTYEKLYHIWPLPLDITWIAHCNVNAVHILA